MKLMLSNTNQEVAASGPGRRLVTRKNRAVVTRFTDEEAYGVCKHLRSSTFACDLTERPLHRLSAEQVIWCHILAVDNTTLVNVPVSHTNIGSVLGILTLFDAARKHLQSPALRLLTEDGTEVKVSLAGREARYPGNIYVKSGRTAENVYYGRITPEGAFVETQHTTEAVRLLLQALAARPEETATAYGKMTGRCCFCAAELTDERSLRVGYGQRCAKSYGLRWGKESLWAGATVPAGNDKRALVAA